MTSACAAEELKVGGSLFCHKNIHKRTWQIWAR